MKPRNALLYALMVLYVFFWFGGVLSHVFLGGPPAHVAWTAPLFLGLAGVLVLASSDTTTFARLLVAGAIGLIAELAGVHTGLPFGPYAYSSALFPSLMGVPLVMTCAWFVLAAYWNQILSPLSLTAVARIVTFGLALTATDLIIDPLAAGPLEYWSWSIPGRYYGIPLSNFVGWFLVSCVIGWATRSVTAHNKLHLFVGISITAFFTILAVAHTMWTAAMVGIVLIAIGWYSKLRMSIRQKPKDGR